MTSTAEYRWIVLHDYMDDAGYGDRKGTEGPRNLDRTIIKNPTNWIAYDDDKNPVYSGRLFGDYDGFEPLDDFATPDAGCTCLKLNGEWL